MLINRRLILIINYQYTIKINLRIAMYTTTITKKIQDRAYISTATITAARISHFWKLLFVLDDVCRSAAELQKILPIYTCKVKTHFEFLWPYICKCRGNGVEIFKWITLLLKSYLIYSWYCNPKIFYTKLLFTIKS